MPAASELVAAGRTEEEVRQAIGADRLIYQELPDLIEAAREGNPRIARFDASCFDGVYVTGDVDRSYLDRIERNRNDFAKTRRATAAPAGEVAYAEVLTFPR
jgi:amidophosphoribosyltransferase